MSKSRQGRLPYCCGRRFHAAIAGEHRVRPHPASAKAAVKPMPNPETITEKEVIELVEDEYQQASYIPLQQALAPYLILPFIRMLRWPYGTEQKEYPYWVVADISPCKRDLMLAYSQFGHGHRGNCWGIIGIDEQWYGRDDSWFSRLEDAFISTGAWPEPLPEDYEIS